MLDFESKKELNRILYNLELQTTECYIFFSAFKRVTKYSKAIKSRAEFIKLCREFLSGERIIKKFKTEEERKIENLERANLRYREKCLKK